MLDDVTLVTSAYAIAEAERNLEEPDQRTRLYRLTQMVEIAGEAPKDAELPGNIRLPAKDVPILLGAIHARCACLLTGDRRHFGRHFGRSVGGVKILTVRDYLTARTHT